jgi:hypothetical protein
MVLVHTELLDPADFEESFPKDSEKVSIGVSANPTSLKPHEESSASKKLSRLIATA